MRAEEVEQLFLRLDSPFQKKVLGKFLTVLGTYEQQYREIVKKQMIFRTCKLTQWLYSDQGIFGTKLISSEPG